MSYNSVIIGTDGGCRGNQTENNIGAYAAILQFGEHEKEVSGIFKNTTNNKMEILAVTKALQAMKRYDLPVILYSDSAYVVNCINKQWYVNWRKNGWVKKNGDLVKNSDLWKELIDELEKFDDITILKVKGHSNHNLNNKVDALVNKTIDNYMY